jgi:hypothetical protein
MIKLGDVVGERVCGNCKWVKYYGGGIWICTKGKVCEEVGVMEVHPLQRGCDKWETKEKEGE